MNNYERFFGTQDRALKTLYSMKIDCTEHFEKSERLLTHDFLSGNGIWKHNVEHFMDWKKWLEEETDQ